MPADPLRLLALGDSYTVGEGVAGDRGWPRQVTQRLRHEGIALADPQVVAMTGWTCAELSAGMDAASLAPPYDLVTLLAGVNDQYRGGRPGDYRTAIAALLGRAVALAGDRPRRVVAISIPDWGVTRFAREQHRDREAIAAELDTFNAIGRDEVHRVGAHWVDVTPLSRACGETVGMLAHDGLHPSATQYTLWTQRILPVVREALRSRH